jgi:hypothetical protein
VGGSLDIEIKQMLVYADLLAHLFVVDEASQEVGINHCVLVNALTAREADTDCILLGQCCDVTVSNCRMVAALGIVQADRQALERARTALALRRPPQAPEEQPGGDSPTGEVPGDQETAPVVVTTLRELHVDQNRIHFADTGIELQDVLTGGIENNRLTAITFGHLDTFSRAANQLPPGPDGVVVHLLLEYFFAVLEKHLEALSVCPPPAPVEEEPPEGEEEQGDGSAIPPDTTGVMACVMEGMKIRRNAVMAETGVALDYSRFVNVNANGITANAAGVLLQYGFDSQIEENIIHIARADNLTQEEEQMDLAESLWGRYRPGDYGIGFRFGRGLRINANDIHAPTAIGVRNTNWRRCREISADALIRVLRIERPFRAFTELFWFLYQLILLLSAGEPSDTDGTGNAADAGVAQTQKEQFGLRMLRWYEGFINSSLFPAFVGKTEIANNRLNVSRFGVFLYKVFSVSGLRVLRNRISGFRKTGVLVHPWYAVGFADKFVRAMRCVVTWIIVFLTMLRDGLRGFIDGQEPGEQPDGGFAGSVPGVITAAVSWILMICSRYCAGTQPPTEDGEDEPPPSPVEALVDELDDFLDHVSLSWLDDLVNQAYDIDRNVLAGSGDGLSIAIDGSRIIGNTVTIWPISLVPYETVIFGILIRKYFEDTEYYSSDIAFVAESAMEMDRDLMIYGILNLLWPNDYIEDATFQSQFRSFLSALAAQVDASSPLMGPVKQMQQSLGTTPPDLDQFGEAWLAFWGIMIRDLWGYGIVMRGANMVCRHNRVEAKTGCQDPFADDDQAKPDTDAVLAAQTLRYPWGRQALFDAPAIGGIWQFSNTFGLLLDLVDIVLKKPEGREYIYQLLIWVIFLLVLFSEKERTLAINANAIKKALVHGIRALAVWGQDEADFFDNTVRHALRHGIFHVGLLNEDLTAKVHRNTVIHDEDVSVFRRIEGKGEDFTSLIRVINREGTTLMSHNHGSDNVPIDQESAVHVETDVAGISANHVITSTELAFVVSASPLIPPRGLFTDNMTNKSNYITPPELVQGPDITDL